MNPIQRAITILGIAALIGGLSPTVHAQRTQRTPTQQTPPTQQDTNSEANNEETDLPLLARTITNFLKGDIYQTESDLSVSGVAPGATVTFNAKVNTIVESPKKFRSEITFLQPGTSGGAEYLIVSNGSEVWIYRADEQKYAVTTYEKFDKADDTFLVGLSSLLFLDISPKDKKALVQSNRSGSSLLEQLGLSGNVPITGGQRTIEGSKYYLYEYTDPKEGFTFSALVEPQTATVKQFKMAGEAEGLNIVITEQIRRRVENPILAADIFKFSPPPGTRKVERLPIQPF